MNVQEFPDGCMPEEPEFLVRAPYGSLFCGETDRASSGFGGLWFCTMEPDHKNDHAAHIGLEWMAARWPREAKE